MSIGSRIKRYFAIAAEAAKKSTCIQHQLGAVLVARTGRAYTIGYNLRKTHPRFATRSIHAEMKALLNATRAGISTRGATLYVVRLSARGQLMQAQPCATCQLSLNEAGIETIYYTTAYGEAAIEQASERDWTAAPYAVIRRRQNRARPIGLSQVVQAEPSQWAAEYANPDRTSVPSTEPSRTHLYGPETGPRLDYNRAPAYVGFRPLSASASGRSAAIRPYDYINDLSWEPITLSSTQWSWPTSVDSTTREFLDNPGCPAPSEGASELSSGGDGDLPF